MEKIFLIIPLPESQIVFRTCKLEADWESAAAKIAWAFWSWEKATIWTNWFVCS